MADLKQSLEEERIFNRQLKAGGHKRHSDYLGDVVEQKYNDALKSVGKSLWNGMGKFFASGFGKGLLITAGVVLLGAAITFGFAASMGLVTGSWVAGNTVMAVFPATVAQGIEFGLGQAMQFLLHPLGLMTLGLGGTVGAVAKVRREQEARSIAEKARLETLYELHNEQAQGKTQPREQKPERDAERDNDYAETPTPQARANGRRNVDTDARERPEELRNAMPPDEPARRNRPAPNEPMSSAPVPDRDDAESPSDQARTHDKNSRNWAENERVRKQARVALAAGPGGP